MDQYPGSGGNPGDKGQSSERRHVICDLTHIQTSLQVTESELGDLPSDHPEPAVLASYSQKLDRYLAQLDVVHDEMNQLDITESSTAITIHAELESLHFKCMTKLQHLHMKATPTPTTEPTFTAHGGQNCQSSRSPPSMAKSRTGPHCGSNLTLLLIRNVTYRIWKRCSISHKGYKMPTPGR